MRCVVYTCSYSGKLGYNANITQIENAYSLSHSTVGMVSTFFFFAYGIGQIINGILCKRYNVRLVVFGSLLISGLMNLLVGFSNDFAFIKYFWLVNGAALDVLVLGIQPIIRIMIFKNCLSMFLRK